MSNLDKKEENSPAQVVKRGRGRPKGKGKKNKKDKENKIWAHKPKRRRRQFKLTEEHKAKLKEGREKKNAAVKPATV